MSAFPSPELRQNVARLIGYQFAALVSRNPMPHISGDPRLRIQPHERERFDWACEAATERIFALSPLAAAPDLLEALKRLVEVDDDDLTLTAGEVRSRLEEARAAIAKAEGR